MLYPLPPESETYLVGGHNLIVNYDDVFVTGHGKRDVCGHLTAFIQRPSSAELGFNHADALGFLELCPTKGTFTGKSKAAFNAALSILSLGMFYLEPCSSA